MEILIVENGCIEIGLLKKIIDFSQPDWRLSQVSSGEECLDMIRNGSSPDVVILEMGVKDMSGLELLERIREYSDIPVVVLSCDKDVYLLVRALDAVASDYIVRPFSNRILLARLKALVRRREWDMKSRRREPVADSTPDIYRTSQCN
jgi:DNA-binding response OmpR family regulator